MKQIKLTSDLKALVLASDGLWTHWDDDKVADEVSRMRTSGKKPQQIAEAITEAIAEAHEDADADVPEHLACFAQDTTCAIEKRSQLTAAEQLADDFVMSEIQSSEGTFHHFGSEHD